MKTSLFVATCCAAVVCARAAGATYTSYTGAQCIPEYYYENPSDSILGWSIGFSPQGTPYTYLTMICPTVLTTPAAEAGSAMLVVPSLASLHMDVVDSASTEEFECTPFFVGPREFFTFAPTRYTCSVPGGCPDYTTQFTGITTLDWTFTGMPIGTVAMGVECVVPAGQGGGYSAITDYVVQQ